MIVDFKCLNEACGCVKEVYFPTYSHFKEKGPSEKCERCGTPMKRLFGGANIVPNEVPGYEKANKDHMTFGKKIDQSFGKWV